MRASSKPEVFSRIEQLESRTLFSASFVSQLAANTPVTANTVPGNGDQNPYGVAFVPQSAAGGKLVAGDILVSNFNDSNNTQGTGSTIVEINPNTQAQTVFFQGQGQLGLTTALGVLPGGFVLVGNVPADSSGNAVPPGSLLIINRSGQVVENLVSSKFLDGPWDLTVVNHGFIQTVFVSDVLNGTVSRLDFLVNPFGFGKPFVLDEAQVASGYQFGPNSTAFELGPTGLAFDQKSDTLYVASTEDNAIFAVHHAQIAFNQNGTGKLIFANDHLRGPLALAFAPNGDLITANGDAINPDTSATNPQNSEIVEFTVTGKFVGQFQIDPGVGGAFGFAVETQGDQTIFAAVDDVTNMLDIWFLQ